MNQQLNYQPLRAFMRVIITRIWIKRARLIVVRLLIAGFIIWLATGLLGKGDASFEAHYDGSIDVGLILALILAYWVLMIWLTTMAWSRFAKANGLHQATSTESMAMSQNNGWSSFLRVAAVNMLPLKIGDRWLGTQLYKEGGLVRWREYHIDLWLRDDAPERELPHILLDARPRDEYRRSNLRKKLPEFSEFTAEGEAGSNYRIYTGKGGETDALAIFTPDVLAVLLDTLPGVDIELNGQSIWFILRNPALSTHAAELFIEGVGTVMPEITQQLRPYTKKVTANSERAGAAT